MPEPARPETGDDPPQRGSGEPAPPNVLVIGAGSSGLVALRALRRRGIDAIAMEVASRVGGLWVYESDSGVSRAYETLCINTSVAKMELSEFPMPRDHGDFPPHTVVSKYFEDYARTFDLERYIRFRTRVLRVTERSDGRYDVESSSREGITTTEVFAAVVVASGHHAKPLIPNVGSTFVGSILHSGEYRTPEFPVEMAEKRVVVVGFGNSAVDIASDIATRGKAKSVTLAARRGAWVLPKYLRGRPIDDDAVIPLWLPGKLRRHIVTGFFRLLHGDMEKFGLPRPDHLIGEAHPTISDALPDLVKRGAIVVERGLEKLEGTRASFAGGNESEVDVVVFATGYRTEFPFFDPEYVKIENNTVELFLRVFHPLHRRLFFIGLAQPLGAIFPLAELQAQLVAEHLMGKYNLPSPERMQRAIAREAKVLRKRYVPSPRHSMQLDPELYVRALKREFAEGERRAIDSEGLRFPRLEHS